MAELEYALSVKQPWAALLIHGRKTVEVRRWSTARRGRVLIHAARVSAPQPFAWEQLPLELHANAKVTGGIVGAGDLTDCIAYRTPEEFAADQGRHLNDPTWFEPPVLYGFVFAHLEPVEFRSFPGWVRFFPVRDKPPHRGRGKKA